MKYILMNKTREVLSCEFNEVSKFFDNDFDYAEFMEASLSKNSKMIQNETSLKTPNNTTDGM